MLLSTLVVCAIGISQAHSQKVRPSADCGCSLVKKAAKRQGADRGGWAGEKWCPPAQISPKYFYSVHFHASQKRTLRLFFFLSLFSIVWL